MYAASWNSFSIETHKLIRILLIAAILTVGSLQVTKCSNDSDDVEYALRDQHNRMNP